MKDFDTVGRFVHLLEIGATQEQLGRALDGLLGRESKRSASLKGPDRRALRSLPVSS
jgi:hypothetical protein